MSSSLHCGLGCIWSCLVVIQSCSQSRIGERLKNPYFSKKKLILLDLGQAWQPGPSANQRINHFFPSWFGILFVLLGLPNLGLPWYHKDIISWHATATWLFIRNKNPTFDQLATWDEDMEPICLLCGVQDESRNDLFFECSYFSILFGVMSRTGFIS